MLNPQDKYNVAYFKVDYAENTNPEFFISSPGAIDQRIFVGEALNKHAQELGETFAEDSDWQAFLTDIVTCEFEF